MLKLAVISWWALDGSSYFLVGTVKILGNTAFQCIPVTQPPHVANKHIFVPTFPPPGALLHILLLSLQ